MNGKINESEQWLLSGDCSKCRRNNYCTKPCTRAKRVTHALMKSMVKSKLNEATGGIYGKFLNEAVDQVMM